MKSLLALLLLAATSFAQHDMSHHSADVKHHGAEAMGFDQDKTTHHFVLTKDGGYVQVTANNSKDETSIGQIRSHLQLQEKRFAAGDFAAPEHTHGQVPPGVPAMRELKSRIQYLYQSVPGGGRLRMTSQDPKAVSAIHDFLKFQISDHQTGDPTKVR